MLRFFRAGFEDIRESFRLRRVWMMLAKEDIVDQHRKTFLGPLWFLFNYLAFSATFIFVFHRVDPENINYAVYVATGLLVWFYLMEVLTQSSSLFVREESLIKGTTLPLFVYVMRLSTQCLIRTAYALLGCLLIVFFSAERIELLSWVYSFAGLCMVVLCAPAVITLSAFLGAYFSDFQFLITNIMRLGMFLTPVFWLDAGDHDIRTILYHWNPFTYYLEVVRFPVVSGGFPMSEFLIVGGATLVLWCFAILVLGGLRKKVVLVL